MYQLIWNPQLSQQDLKQIEEIFFLSSSIQNFKDQENKERFFKRWCGQYIELFPEWLLIAQEDNGRVLGYMLGCPDTARFLEQLSIPGMSQFSREFDEYPVHLHINLDSTQRGRGLGSVMFEEFRSQCVRENKSGIFLITQKHMRNVGFYLKNGFAYCREADYKGHPLLFMGQALPK